MSPIYVMTILFILSINIAQPRHLFATDTMIGVHKASTLIGKIVKDARGEDIGVIEEIVITTSGEVAYAVLSFGGFLGMGDKLFAVPWTSLFHGTHEDFLTLYISREKLARAPGFNPDDWPDMKDKNWNSKIWDFYKDSSKQPTKKKPADQ